MQYIVSHEVFITCKLGWLNSSVSYENNNHGEISYSKRLLSIALDHHRKHTFSGIELITSISGSFILLSMTCFTTIVPLEERKRISENFRELLASSKQQHPCIVYGIRMWNLIFCGTQTSLHSPKYPDIEHQRSFQCCPVDDDVAWTLQMLFALNDMQWRMFGHTLSRYGKQGGNSVNPQVVEDLMYWNILSLFTAFIHRSWHPMCW